MSKMRRAWMWYRARRWWVRILLAVPVGLVAITALYLMVRAFQYRAAGGMEASEFLPSDVHVIVRSTGAAEHWERILQSEFGKIVRTRMLRDKAVRDELNALLKGSQVPTLDQLEDRRFQEGEGAMLTEANLWRFAGRDLLAAFKLSGPKGAMRFCVAGRLGYWEYVLTPFAGWILPKTSVDGVECYSTQGVTIAIVGPIAVVSDDQRMLASALKRRGRLPSTRKPIEVTVTTDSSPALADVRAWLSGWPNGHLLVASGESNRATFTVDVKGADVVVEGQLEGLKSAGANAPTDAARWVTPDGVGAVLLSIGGDRLWGLLEKQNQGALREVLKLLEEARFSQRVPGLVRGPASLILGSAIGEGQRTYASVALVLRSEDPSAAEQALREAIQELVREAQEKIGLVQQIVQGQAVWALDWGPDPFKYTDYARPCWVVLKDALVVANNLDFLVRVVNVSGTPMEGMLEESFYRTAEARLQKLGLKAVLGEGTVASGFIYGPSIREGLEGFWPLLADKMTDNDAARRQLSADLEAQWRREGRTPSSAERVAQFNSVMKERTIETENRLRGRARVLEYLRWIAFEVVEEEGGLRIKAAVELK